MAVTKQHPKTVDLIYAEGCQNRFIIVDRTKARLSDEALPELAAELGKRHNIDSMLVIEQSSVADARMRILEKDKSESDMCGNGIRCVALYLTGSNTGSSIMIETRSGIKEVTNNGDKMFTVDMGRPEVEPLTWRKNSTYAGTHYTTYFVNSGEPHLVIIANDVSKADIKQVGKAARDTDEYRENGVNVNFVQVIDRHNIRIRTYERGVEDETQACGTGATASVVAAVKLGLVEPGPVKVQCNGGELTILYNGGRAFLTGPATITKTEEHKL